MDKNYTGICQASPRSTHPEIQGQWLTLIEGVITNIFDNPDEAEKHFLSQIWEKSDNYYWIGQITHNVIEVLKLPQDSLGMYVLITNKKVQIIESQLEAEDIAEEFERYTS
ncbi:hypothetical protein [Synechococcus sp. PCC 6312]|uniref:hypothetical protein n=1 Tax=Synechococcus sp. (strain ATCC 27167 / PCC 6312) TaxID=195253 RepID=UPI00029EDB20|nr:hypothetical protein [Synechococcus sp. PCC 6312]AFY61963.1 hypothetical protein Syn6312_2900 [Synechococcus sp. PCC 6312]